MHFAALLGRQGCTEVQYLKVVSVDSDLCVPGAMQCDGMNVLGWTTEQGRNEA